MNPVRIAVDVASGDFGTSVLVKGVVDALESVDEEFVPVLCGPRATIEQILSDQSKVSALREGAIEIEDCPDEIAPSDIRAQAWKRRSGAAVIRCIGLQREGRVDASVCAGDTGVFMAASLFVLGRLDGVRRPALAATIPTVSARRALLLDVGANVNCRAEDLVCFAELGREYVKRFYGIESPKVALLNVGAEPSKGTRTVAEAAEMLAQRGAGYQGFIEGSRVLSGDVEVIVCDGFIGNVLLKVCESFYALTESVLGNVGQTLSAVRENMAVLNAENYGAVPLLGIRGIVLKAHGSSSSQAIANAVATTIAAVRRHVVPVSSQVQRVRA